MKLVVESEAGEGQEQAPKPARTYLAVCGVADATKPLAKALMRAAWFGRIVYNATIDRHVAFADGIRHRVTASEARRAGLPEPAEPLCSTTFLPVPDPFALNAELTLLRAEIPALADFPATMFRAAIAKGCEARKQHVEACAKAKAAGRKLPRLRFRSAADDVDVASDNARISRCGDGPALTQPRRGKRSNAKRNRARKAKNAARKARRWAERKRLAGWSEDRIAARLAEREARKERQRQAQAAGDAARLKPTGKLPRRDSPKATVGEAKVRITAQGLGTFRVRLSRPIPKDGRFVRLHLCKAAGHGTRIEVRLVYDVPAAKRTHDELETGAALHAVVRALPADASPLDAVEAVRAAGIKVVGDDLGILAPSTDDRGHRTRPVKPLLRKVRTLEALQKALSHKDRLALDAKVEVPSEAPAAEAAPMRRRPKRSRRAEKLRARIARKGRKARNRSRTRAQQDARRLLADEPVLVASDPQRMAAPLMRKGGPAERRAERERLGLAPDAPLPSEARPPRGYALSPAQRRTQRANMHRVTPGYRIRRLRHLCEASGTVHATPGHEGSSSTCPACRRFEKKDLGQRIHCCPCGLVMDRDQASAVYTLGTALLEYREGPDPGGRVAAARAGQAERAAKSARKREAQAKGGRKAGARRQASSASRHMAGVTPADAAPAASKQGVVALRLGNGAEHQQGRLAVLS